jgi:hypothetical protein
VQGSRYIVMFSASARAHAPLRALLSDLAGVTLLRADDEHALVSMSASTAELLQHRYPFLTVEEDLRYHRASSSR